MGAYVGQTIATEIAFGGRVASLIVEVIGVGLD